MNFPMSTQVGELGVSLRTNVAPEGPESVFFLKSPLLADEINQFDISRAGEHNMSPYSFLYTHV